MKTLLLLRHAKSSWKDDEIPDHDRALNQRGKKAAPLMGRLLASEKLVPDLILSSTAKRARETAEAASKAAGFGGEIELLESLYLATAGTILAEAQRRTPNSIERLLVVGHNPGMEELVAILSGSQERFPTAALAVFELSIEGWRALELGVPARLVRIYRPKELQ